MKGNAKLGLILLLIVMVGIGLIQAGQREPIRWNRTYNPEDKIPFGAYIFKNELKNFFPDSNKIEITDIRESFYLYFSKPENKKLTGTTLFYLGNYFGPSKASQKALLDFVAQGNTFFLSSQNIYNEDFRDTLGFATAYYNPFTSTSFANDDSIKLQTTDSNLSAYFNKTDYGYYFDSLKTKKATILGYTFKDSVKIPYYVKFEFGKGRIYVHLAPDVFTNYYLKKKTNERLAFATLQDLHPTQILWFDQFNRDDFSGTPLRFILSRPALRYGWYILLLTLVLYLIFKSKREQRAVPIITPEENLSVAFAETIGSLYYENGTPGDMIQKKIKYFLYNLKRDYHFSTVEPEDPRWLKRAETRLGIPNDQLEEFFRHLKAYNEMTNPNIQNLKDLQHLIDHFKQEII